MFSGAFQIVSLNCLVQGVIGVAAGIAGAGRYRRGLYSPSPQRRN